MNRALFLAEFRHEKPGVFFVGLPGAEYWMGIPDEERRALMGDFHGGRTSALHRGAFSESPWHRVVLSPLLIANYEVGQKEWLRLMPLDCLSPIPRRGEGS